MTTKVLRRAGYIVHQVATGAEAVERMLELEAPIDVLVTDVVMPGMSGVDLADRVFAESPDAGVVLLSGYTGRDPGHRAGRASGRHLPVEAGQLRRPACGRGPRGRAAVDPGRRPSMTEERDSAGRVLVVDDAADLRRLIGIALRRAGFDVLEAASGEAALEIVRTSPVDLVVLDMGLPGMSGTDVIRALRKRPESITLPVLLMTGSGTSESVVENLDAGASDFLAKPVRLDELVARVRAHMRSNDAWSGLVEDELRVRASVVSALGRMTLSTEPEAAAEAVVDELARRTDSPFISVLQLVSGNRLQPLATYNRGDRLRRGGPPVRADRAHSLMAKAREGPWAERAPVGDPGAADGPFSLAGIALLAGAPIYAGGAVVGVLNIGAGGAGFTPSPAEQAKLMAAAIDYASILSAVAGSALADRREVAEVRSKLRRDLAARAFYPVFQPIVALQTREVVGFEALSRFTDGTAPDVRFAEAAALGLGDEFELAAIDAALVEAPKLPEGKFLTLNVSPAVALSAGKRLRRKLAGSSRTSRARVDRTRADRRLRPVAECDRRARQRADRGRRRRRRVCQHAPHPGASTGLRQAGRQPRPGDRRR